MHNRAGKAEKNQGMKVIIESGATKGDWRLISADGREIGQFPAEGTNVSTMKMETIVDRIIQTGRKVKESASERITSVHFYTAGVITEQIRHELSEALMSVFSGAETEIQDDLTAAARSVCGHNPGIAAILGTGSNSCQFDGERIVRRIYSGGFILGDEGSAARLGKLFISDFLKGLVPAHIANALTERCDTSYEAIVENIYRSSGSPSAYLGDLAPFIMEHYEDPYIRNLVDGNFRAFFERSVRQYDYATHPVGITGGFGNALKDIICRIADEEGVRISGFMPKPMEGLIRYHTGQKI